MSVGRRMILIEFARNNGGVITKKEAVGLLKHNYYHNASKYVGETLSKMVKSGYLIRVKRGHYKIVSKIN